MDFVAFTCMIYMAIGPTHYGRFTALAQDPMRPMVSRARSRIARADVPRRQVMDNACGFMGIAVADDTKGSTVSETQGGRTTRGARCCARRRKYATRVGLNGPAYAAPTGDLRCVSKHHDGRVNGNGICPFSAGYDVAILARRHHLRGLS